MIFFIEWGEKTGGYIVMVHCFSQSVFCIFIIKPEPVPAVFFEPVVVDQPIIMCNHRRGNGTTMIVI